MDNVGFVVAAYLITATLVTTYTLRVQRRLARARAAAAKQGES